MQFKLLSSILGLLAALFTMPAKAGYVLNCHSAHLFANQASIQAWENRIQNQYQITGLFSDLPNLQHISERFGSLTVEQKKALQAEIQKAYGAAHTGQTGKKLKRSLDVLITRMIDPYRKFAQQGADGRSVLQTWDQILEQTAQLTGMKDRFTADQILKSLIGLQRNLQSLSDADYWIRRTSFFVYGSWPNGRALRQHSDVDIFSEDPNQRKYFDRLNSSNTAKQMGLAEISPTSRGFQAFEYLAVSNNPIMFKISPDTIELIVYPLIEKVEFSTEDPPKPLSFVVYRRDAPSN